MKRTGKLYSLVVPAVLVCLTLSACGTAATATPEPSATVNLDEIQTAVVSTYSRGLTQTAILLPTDTPIPTPIDTLTPVSSFNTPIPPAGGTLPTVSSCYGLTFVQDVTIPDNTAMAQGQAFTKTWRVRNSGSCAWDAGFKFAFVGGNAMNGATLVLDSAVNPGAQKDLSILMKAPNAAGPVRGTWRMSTAGGTYFGDQVFVLINVGNTTASVTPTPSKTPTKTTTAGTPTHTATVSLTLAHTATATLTLANTSTATPTITETTVPPTSNSTPSETPSPTDTPTPP
jgi:hypothetical protein